MRTRAQQLLLGEWACLGVLSDSAAHGFAVSKRLRPDGDIGRVWSLSRALTYRALAQLEERSLVEAVAEEPGIAGGNRTIVAPTTAGREALAAWVQRPVDHLRDLRSELLLKLVIAEMCMLDTGSMLAQQHQHVEAIASSVADQVAAAEAAGARTGTGVDVVLLWRMEATQAALRFLQRLDRPAPVITALPPENAV